MCDLRKFIFLNNQIGDIGVSSIANSFKYITKLEAISFQSIYNNLIDILIDCRCGFLGLEAISKYLHYVTNLRSFGISEISNCQSSLQKVMKSIKQLSLLKILSFTSILLTQFSFIASEISDDTFSILCNNLSKLKNLEEVDIDSIKL